LKEISFSYLYFYGAAPSLTTINLIAGDVSFLTPTNSAILDVYELLKSALTHKAYPYYFSAAFLNSLKFSSCSEES